MVQESELGDDADEFDDNSVGGSQSDGSEEFDEQVSSMLFSLQLNSNHIHVNFYPLFSRDQYMTRKR